MVSDKVQLRLRMTQEQIDEANANHTGDGTRFFNQEIRKVWEGTTRASVNPKGKAYWGYYAQQARDIAARKTKKNSRKYWNRKAREYQEKSDAATN